MKKKRTPSLKKKRNDQGKMLPRRWTQALKARELSMLDGEGGGGSGPGCPYPVNFRLVSATDIGDGVLRFNYAFESSTGHLADLAGCFIGEVVNYPGPNPYYPPNPPFNWGLENPWIRNFPNAQVESGTIIDYQRYVAFATPYQAASYTATQIYRYKATCMTNWVTLMGPIDITRSVYQDSSGVWFYKVQKSLYYAIKLLP